jgi:hypothetical protein
VGVTSSLEWEIGAGLAGAERLLASAAMVGDGDDHTLWKASRELWVKSTIENLDGAAAEGSIRTFARAVTPPPGEGSVAEDLPIELEAIRAGMAVLIGMRSQAASATPADRPANERRGPRLGP